MIKIALNQGGTLSPAYSRRLQLIKWKALTEEAKEHLSAFFGVFHENKDERKALTMMETELRCTTRDKRRNMLLVLV